MDPLLFRFVSFTFFTPALSIPLSLSQWTGPESTAPSKYEGSSAAHTDDSIHSATLKCTNEGLLNIIQQFNVIGNNALLIFPVFLCKKTCSLTPCFITQQDYSRVIEAPRSTLFCFSPTDSFFHSWRAIKSAFIVAHSSCFWFGNI